MAASRATLTAISRLRRVQEIDARRALESLKVTLDEAFARHQRAAARLGTEEDSLDRARKDQAFGKVSAGKIQRLASFVDGQRARVKTARVAYRTAARELSDAERALDKGRRKLEHAIAAREAVEAHMKALAQREERARTRRAERQAEDRWRPKR
jgi:exonuclease VII small subunit